MLNIQHVIKKSKEVKKVMIHSAWQANPTQYAIVVAYKSGDKCYMLDVKYGVKPEKHDIIGLDKNDNITTVYKTEDVEELKFYLDK